MQGNQAIRMATSILDYIFRELAISYLGRTDLAHVDAEKLVSDTLGEGRTEGKETDTAQQAIQAISNPFASSGFIRSNLHILHNKTANTNKKMTEQVIETTKVVASASAGSTDAGMATTISMGSHSTTSTTITASPSTQVAEAKMKGFEGDSCGDCGNFYPGTQWHLHEVRNLW